MILDEVELSLTLAKRFLITCQLEKLRLEKKLEAEQDEIEQKNILKSLAKNESHLNFGLEELKKSIVEREKLIKKMEELKNDRRN